MKVRVDLDTRTFVRFWLVVIGFGLAGLLIYTARHALFIICTAAFLALVLHRPVKRLAGLLPGKSRLGGTALAFASLVIFLVLVVWFVAPPIIHQTAKFAESVPDLIDTASEQWKGIDDFIEANNLREQVDSSLESIKNQASDAARAVGDNILSGVTSLASAVASFFMIVVLAFLMLLEGPLWINRLWGLYSDHDKMVHHKELAGKAYNVVTGYVNGQLTISGIGSLFAGGFVFGLSFFFAEIDASLAMPTILITFVLTLVPMFGATIAGALMTLLLGLNSVTAAIIYLVFFIIYQQVENNFISPVIQSKKVELSALTVLVSVTIGLYISGIVGGVIAIPIAGTIKVLLEDYLDQSKKKREESQKMSAKLVNKIKKTSKK